MEDQVTITLPEKVYEERLKFEHELGQDEGMQKFIYFIASGKKFKDYFSDLWDQDSVAIDLFDSIDLWVDLLKFLNREEEARIVEIEYRQLKNQALERAFQKIKEKAERTTSKMQDTAKKISG